MCGAGTRVDMTKQKKEEASCAHSVVPLRRRQKRTLREFAKESCPVTSAPRYISQAEQAIQHELDLAAVLEAHNALTEERGFHRLVVMPGSQPGDNPWQPERAPAVTDDHDAAMPVTEMPADNPEHAEDDCEMPAPGPTDGCVGPAWLCAACGRRFPMLALIGAVTMPCPVAVRKWAGQLPATVQPHCTAQATQAVPYDYYLEHSFAQGGWQWSLTHNCCGICCRG